MPRVPNLPLRNFQQLLVGHHAKDPLIGEFTECANKTLGRA